MNQRTFTRPCIVAWLLAVVLFGSARGRADEKATVIFRGGDIVTINHEMPSAKALAIRDEKIVEVGSWKDVAKWRGEQTKIVELEGKTLMPGLIEPHSHPIGSAVLYDWIDISGFDGTIATKAQLFDKLEQAVKNSGDEKWILAFGYDPLLTSGLTALHKSELDKMSPEKPLLILAQTMHTAYANSAALRAAGVDASTNPGGGGRFEKDASGDLTGKIIESPAILLMFEALKKDGVFACNKPAELVRQQLDRYTQAGVTTVGGVGLLRLFDHAEKILAREAGKRASVRNVHYVAANFGDVKNIDPFSGNAFFGTPGYKFWIDGSPYTGTMLLNDPYLENDLMQKALGAPKNNRGQYMFNPEQLKEGLAQRHGEGWQLAVHAQGDRAVAETLAVYQCVLKEPWGSSLNKEQRAKHPVLRTGGKPRHRIEHLVLASKRDVKKAAELDVTLSFHVNHLYYYGDALRDSMLGRKRAERMLPLQSAVKQGHRITFHADSPMFPVEPFRLMQTAVTRKTRLGTVIGIKQAITIDEALKALTIHAAWQLHMEQSVGSLEPGKLADLVVLSANPRKACPDELASIKVEQTWVGGKIKWREKRMDSASR